MVRAKASHHLAATGLTSNPVVLNGELQRNLDRLTSAWREVNLLHACRGEVDQLLCQLQSGLRAVAEHVEERQVLHLPSGNLDQTGATVADRHGF